MTTKTTRPKKPTAPRTAAKAKPSPNGTKKAEKASVLPSTPVGQPRRASLSLAMATLDSGAVSASSDKPTKMDKSGKRLGVAHAG